MREAGHLGRPGGPPRAGATRSIHHGKKKGGVCWRSHRIPDAGWSGVPLARHRRRPRQPTAGPFQTPDSTRTGLGSGARAPPDPPRVPRNARGTGRRRQLPPTQTLVPGREGCKAGLHHPHRSMHRPNRGFAVGRSAILAAAWLLTRNNSALRFRGGADNAAWRSQATDPGRNLSWWQDKGLARVSSRS